MKKLFFYFFILLANKSYSQKIITTTTGNDIVRTLNTVKLHTNQGKVNFFLENYVSHQNEFAITFRIAIKSKDNSPVKIGDTLVLVTANNTKIFLTAGLEWTPAQSAESTVFWNSGYNIPSKAFDILIGSSVNAIWFYHSGTPICFMIKNRDKDKIRNALVKLSAQ